MATFCQKHQKTYCAVRLLVPHKESYQKRGKVCAQLSVSNLSEDDMYGVSDLNLKSCRNCPRLPFCGTCAQRTFLGPPWPSFLATHTYPCTHTCYMLSAQLRKDNNSTVSTYKQRRVCSTSTPRGGRSPRHHCNTPRTYACMAASSKAKRFVPITFGASG